MTALSTAVSQASDDAVISAGAALGSKRKAWPFLPLTSQILERKALPFIEGLYPATSPAEFDDLADYLVLAASCHALDGWRYLSQAAMATLTGARNGAIHLAYYAEMRAALSILAASGIGILRGKHFSLTAARTVEWFTGGTHDAVRKALQEWVKSTVNARRVVESLGVFGIGADDWIDACGATPNTDAVAENWLGNWSIDLKADSVARNEATYRPDLRVQGMVPLNRKEVKFIRDVSSSCKSAGDGQLDSTDIALIYDLCSNASELRFGSKNMVDQRIWADVFRWLTAVQGIDKRSSLNMILAIKDAPFTSAGKLLSLSDTGNMRPNGIFSRAFLLLRLASALKRKQWREIQQRAPGGRSEWQERLITDYGLHSQLWHNTGLFDLELIDEDRAVAEEDLNDYLKNTRRFSPYAIWADRPNALVQLCRFERVGILALAS